MLLDNVLEVIIDRAARNDTRLRALVHRELIQIEARRRLGHERAIGAACIEELTSFRIHLGGIHIVIGRKLRFRAIDIQERKRLTIDGGDGLGSVVHVVRKRRDLVGDACSWSNSSKRFNNHRKTPLPQMDRRTVLRSIVALKRWTNENQRAWVLASAIRARPRRSILRYVSCLIRLMAYSIPNF